MSAQFDSTHINSLIAADRIEEAKAILRTFDDPQALSWLARLEKRYTSAPIITDAYKEIESTYQYYGGRTRGTWLTAWLGLITIGNVLFTLFLLFAWPQVSRYNRIPSWTVLAVIISGIILVVCLIGIWMWKRWALIGYFLTHIVGILLIHMVFASSATSLTPGKNGTIIHLILMTIAFFPKFDQFD